ncbi:hypothetical protein QQF64_000319 [Cirrhinus molitorella]|uniref:Ig-like domain-containing protein n=1 Tax=Cirrhinus molitorella TaxID=172907 RepID=A0ABR3NWY9_9TELE
MRAAIIIFITLCLISGQVLCFKVFGCTGGSVMFKCKNSNQRKSYDQYKGKYFCRNRDCTPGISNEIQHHWVNNGRFSLYDDENSSFFTVFIRNLSREDDGEYTCGNKQKWSHDVTLVVNNKSSSCGTSVIQAAHIGQMITLNCEYEHGFEKHTKVIYSLNVDPVHVLNSSQSSQSSEEKFILSDSQKDHFNVTIRNISTADDGGVYLCGVERDQTDKRPSETSITHITFIKEIHLNVHTQLTSVQAEAYISKSVFIKCKFPQEFKGNKKFIQKDPSQKIPVNKQNQWTLHDNVKMFDDSSEGLLKVFISDLTAADEATYKCGVNIADDHLFTEIKLTVNQADHFLGSKNNEKICQIISSSEQQRFEFSDSAAGVFTVIISNVRLTDAGVYWCGAETRHKHLTSVSLTNKHELTLTMSLVIGREGDSAEIKCPYDANQAKEIKQLCKGKCFTQDAQNIIQSDEAHVKKTKISVKDDTELNLFTVTITDLRAEDVGKYWCAVKDAFNLPIDLMIIMKDGITHEASVRGSVSISCKYIRKNNQSVFCRDQPNICVRDGVHVSSNNRINGRFSLTDQTSAGVFTVNISNLTEEDSGKYWCGEEHSGSFIFTEVHLHVNREMTTSDTKETSQNKEKPEMTTSDTKKETAQETKKPVTEMTTSPTKTETSQDEEKTEMISSDTKTETAHVTEKPEMTTSDTKKETLQETKKPVTEMTTSPTKTETSQDEEKTEMISSDTKTETAHTTEKPEMTTSDTKKETLQETKKPVTEMTTSPTKTETSQDEEKTEMISSDTKTETAHVTEKPEMTTSDTKKETLQETKKPGFPVIAVVSVGLILLALVIVLILIKLKHNKHERRQTGDHETAQEQIQDTRHHSDSDHESTHLYSTVQLPTNPCDSQNPLYSTVQLPTNPSDSQNALYSTVQLPTNLHQFPEAWRVSQ